MLIYGLKNCDSCRLARKWLTAHAIPYQFVDLRNDELPLKTVAFWAKIMGTKVLLNKRSTTWRQLKDQAKTNTASKDAVISLLASHPTLIKRPVLTSGDLVLVGFTQNTQATLSNRTCFVE